MKSLGFGVTLALLAGLATPSFGVELSEEQQNTATAFAVNNSTFVIEHEIGHLFVGEFGLPVLGKEEDAADSLATVLLLSQGTDETNQILIDAADGWYLSDQAGPEELEAADFYDEHSLDIQRAYQVVCLVVGADPEAFGEVAEEYEMDADRQERCGQDYQTAADSWISLLEPHQLAEGAASTGKISVVYDDGGDDYGDIAQMLQDVGFLESAAASVTDNYDLPRDLTFHATSCGTENAFYSRDDASITFCYELVGFFFRLMEDDLASAD